MPEAQKRAFATHQGTSEFGDFAAKAVGTAAGVGAAMGFAGVGALAAMAAPVWGTVAVGALATTAAYNMAAARRDAGQSGTAVFFGGAADLAGASGVVAGYTEKAPITGAPLGKFEAGWSQGMGFVQMVGTALGVKNATKWVGNTLAKFSAPNNYRAFQGEAKEIMQGAATSRGLTPNATYAAMRKTDVNIDDLIPPDTRPFADPSKLAKHGPFNWKEYTPITVVKEGSKFRVQDGMTRIENARRSDITKLPAYVFDE